MNYDRLIIGLVTTIIILLVIAVVNSTFVCASMCSITS